MPKDEENNTETNDESSNTEEQNTDNQKTEEEIADEEFDSAFEEALSGTPTPDSGEENEEDDQTVLEGSEEVQGTEESSNTEVTEETDQSSDGETVFVPTPESPDSSEDGAQDVDYKALYEAEKQRTASWEGRINAANKRAKEAEAKLKELESQPTDKGQSTDTLPDGDGDDKELSEFIEEFPSLRKPIEVLAKRMAKSIIDQELETLRPQIETVVESQKTDRAKVHADTISSAHPDWTEIRDSGKLTRWISAQPPILKRTLQEVYESGTAAEVIDMFDSYKRANGIKLSKPNGGTPTPAPIKKSKADNLLAVPGQSGGPPKAKKKLDKDDFDSAWAEANS
jgi:hypothetical protein